MLTQHQLRQDIAVIQELIALGPRRGYSNYCLEGPRNEKTRAIGFACLYPEDSELPSYRFIAFEPRSRTEVERLREKILDFTVEPRILDLQSNQVMLWEEGPNLVTQAVLEIEKNKARAIGRPLVFVLFGETAAEGRETAHIYHPGNIPTPVALTLLQDKLRAIIERGE